MCLQSRTSAIKQRWRRLVVDEERKKKKKGGPCALQRRSRPPSYKNNTQCNWNGNLYNHGSAAACHHEHGVSLSDGLVVEVDANDGVRAH